jgi:phosphoribosylanthranilate isomerase
MGVDNIGVLVGDGSFPREQTIESAHGIFAAIPSRSKSSLLSLSYDLDLIVRLTTALKPDILPSSRGATASLASPPANTENAVSADFADAQHSRS